VKRPWQIWSLYVLCMAAVVSAMVWLTVKADELDRAEAAARRQAEVARTEAVDARLREEAARRRAELEEDVSLALWRIDTWLAKLIALEAARPHFVYRPYYSVPVEANLVKGGGSGASRQASPLLMQPSQYVQLNFQVSGDNNVSSPQAPPEDLNPWAISNGTNNDNIKASNDLVDQLTQQIDHQQLWAQLPEETLPHVELDDYAWNSRWDTDSDPLNQMPSFSNSNNVDLGQLLAQAEQQDANVPGQQQGEQQAQPAPRLVGPQSGGQPQGQNPGPQNKSQQRYELSRDQQTQAARAGNEYLRRNRALQDYGQQFLSQQRQGIPKQFSKTVVSEGVSRPLWMGPHLLLARRVTIGEKTLVQGAWLDWDKIRAALLSEIADLLPDAELVPVTGEGESNPARMLAALPVRLVVPDAPTPRPPFGMPIFLRAQVSPIRVSLWIAWGCLLLAATAVAVLLWGVVALSERRAAFVAAVTHELRTPLTTFRMYAEMLSEGMVTDEKRRHSYLTTLRCEAERLTHLVSNVLAYARLERGRPGGRREDVAMRDLADRVGARLADRVHQAEMELVVEIDPAAEKRPVRTDPAAVEQILFNLVDNACKYASEADDKRLHLSMGADGRMALFRVRDHGPGISPEARGRLFIPFSKSVHDAANTAPGVGLGLALCRRLARDLGGRLDVEPIDGDGATFVLALPLA
jgi:signal transduction histidine kinase